MDNLQLHLPELLPLHRSVDHVLRSEAETPVLLRPLHPRPRDVQFLEIHVCASCTHVLCIGLYLKQRVLGERPTRNIDQNVLTRPHQVEPLTIDVLQVRIPNRRDRTPPSPSRRSRGNRRTGSRRAGSRRGSRSGSRLHGQVEGWVAGVRRKIGVVLQGCNDGDGNPAWIAVRVQPPVLGVALPSLRGQTRSSKRGPLGGRVSCQDRQYAMMARVDSTNINISASPLGRPLDPTRACCVLWP
mmetsp:Transcript_55200/g.153913  ORF Transcript_55200/g.153913 Transcript_55200/m.153913 type:complete len:242 (-) Transcript_55200:942-1667(-)